MKHGEEEGRADRLARTESVTTAQQLGGAEVCLFVGWLLNVPATG